MRKPSVVVTPYATFPHVDDVDRIRKEEREVYGRHACNWIESITAKSRVPGQPRESSGDTRSPFVACALRAKRLSRYIKLSRVREFAKGDVFRHRVREAQCKSSVDSAGLGQHLLGQHGRPALSQHALPHRPAERGSRVHRLNDLLRRNQRVRRFLMHEAAHVFHNCKQATVGLTGSRRAAYLLFGGASPIPC